MAKSKSKRKAHAKPKAPSQPKPSPARAEAEKRVARAAQAGYYPTKRDLRYRVIIWAVILGLIGPAVTLLWNKPGTSWWLGTMLFTVAMMTLWSVQSIHYRLEIGWLRIVAGLHRRQIPLADIRSVTPVRNGAAAPALSLDRLEIVYTLRGKDETVYISPKDRDAFVQELSQLDRGLKKQDGGLKRR